MLEMIYLIVLQRNVNKILINILGFILVWWKGISFTIHSLTKQCTTMIYKLNVIYDIGLKI